MRWKEKYNNKLISPERAAEFIRSGDKVVVAMFAEPEGVLSALAARRQDIEGISTSFPLGRAPSLV